MICPRCERSNRDTRRFCGGCGAGLQRACVACEFVNDAVDSYCGGCGVAMIGDGLAVDAGANAMPSDVPMLSISELQALLAEVPSTAAPVTSLPQGPIGQDDLDRLFGGAS